VAATGIEEEEEEEEKKSTGFNRLKIENDVRILRGERNMFGIHDRKFFDS
jgi:hypothetical protein